MAAHAGRLERRQEVAFFRAQNATDATFPLYGSDLQGFYQRYGLTFFMRSAPQSTPLLYAINGTREQFEALQEEAGIEPSEEPSPEKKKKLARLTNQILFGALRDFISAQSEPVSERVNVVVLDQVVAPDVARELDGIVGGLGLSPRLLRDVAVSDPQKNLFEELGLPAEFTPTLFVGHGDIVRIGTNRVTVVAHEMGHALGLQHTAGQGNVMTQGQSGRACTPGLDSPQLSQLRQGLVDETSRESVDRLLALRERMVARVLQARR